MTPTEQPGSLPDNLPLLTEVADEDVPDNLPTLTEVVETEPADSAAAIQPTASPDVSACEGAPPASCMQGREEMQWQQQIESHLENVFAHRLGARLEHLQRQAVREAVNELKAELPGLLDALKARPGL